MKESSNKKSSDNFYLRVDRIEEIMSDLGYKLRKDFAHDIGMEPQNLSRCMTSGKVTEKTCKKIINKFPEYRIEWLLGYSDIKTVDDFRSQYVSRRQSVSDACITLLEDSLLEVCLRENIDTPNLNNIPELMLLQAQLRDYADSLMWNYVKHREHSHVWNFLDQIPTSKK